jgi:hypothetical protein
LWTGENGQALPAVASWLAVVVLLIYIAVALGYGFVIAREELRDRMDFKTQKVQFMLSWLVHTSVLRVNTFCKICVYTQVDMVNIQMMDVAPGWGLPSKGTFPRRREVRFWSVVCGCVFVCVHSYGVICRMP